MSSVAARLAVTRKHNSYGEKLLKCPHTPWLSTGPLISLPANVDAEVLRPDQKFPALGTAGMGLRGEGGTSRLPFSLVGVLGGGKFTVTLSCPCKLLIPFISLVSWLWMDPCPPSDCELVSISTAAFKLCGCGG